MIVGYFHQGSGLGNQLHRYVATRVRAADLGVDWGMLYHPDGSGKEEGFKGKGFMNIGNWAESFRTTHHKERYPEYWEEKKIVENGLDIRSYDPEFNFVADNTVIDGEFQDERYWEHHEKDLDSWLKVDSLEIPDDLCVIGFRGGEYAAFPDLFLPKSYYDEAIAMMKEINPSMRFEVHTDDEMMARQLFDYPIVHDIGINWRSMRYAKHAIIANSSFFILPRWIRNGVTIAPRYWARHNTKTWALPQNYYKRFLYI